MDYRLYILQRAQAGDLAALRPLVLANYLQRLVADGHLVVEPPVDGLDKAQLVRQGPFAVREVTRAEVTAKGQALLAELQPALPVAARAAARHPWFG